MDKTTTDDKIDWDSLSLLGKLQAVLDPCDEMGHKNMLIDRVHWIAIRRQIRGSKNILDFGCGTGRFAERIQALDIQYQGIDNSAGMIKAAKKCHLNEKEIFQYFDGSKIPFPDASFDTVIAARVFIHLLKDPEGEIALKEIRRVLKPSGRLILLEEASLSRRKSGQARWTLTEEDFTSALSKQFKVKLVHKVRSSEFSKFARHVTEVQGTPYIFFRLIFAPLARYEAFRIACLSNKYFAKVTYYDFLIHAVVESDKGSHV